MMMLMMFFSKINGLDIYDIAGANCNIHFILRVYACTTLLFFT